MDNQSGMMAEDQVSLNELFRVLWAGRIWILGITMVVTILVAIAAWAFPVMYQSDVTLLPASNNSGGGQLGEVSALTSQLGGIASLAGISVSGDSRKSEAVAVLQSEVLTESYIRENNLLPILYARKWNSMKGTWDNQDPKRIPTLWQGNRYFKKSIRSVATDTKTGLLTVSITWSDPTLAAKWANGIVKLTNDYLRQKAITESERNILYLTNEAAKTDVVGVRQAIYSVLQNEINKEMLARGNEEYALKIVDPAFVSERPSSLSRIVWIVIGIVLGLFFSMAAVIVRHSATSPRS